MIVLAICWRLSAFQSPSHKQSIFLKFGGFFSFNFFQGHNWLTYYPDSEFHDHWKTVTLSPIYPNLSRHWRFLAFWLSLCFGSFLLFRVCHDTAFLFSTRAMTTLAWLPNALIGRLDAMWPSNIPPIFFLKILFLVTKVFNSLFFQKRCFTKIFWHRISIQTLLFQACLPTRQNGVENRDKAYYFRML